MAAFTATMICAHTSSDPDRNNRASTVSASR